MSDENRSNEKILSQNEVDMLLNAVRDGAVETGGNTNASESLLKYDFTKQRKLVRSRMPGLKIIFDRFQRSYRQTLSSLVRKNAVVEFLQTEMLRYSEFIGSLPNPSCLTIMRMSPLIGQTIISMEIPFVYTLIDNIFGGGKMRQYQKTEGDFTTIELKMIQKLAQYFYTDLEKAWATLYEINFEFVRTDTNPEYVSIVAPSDVVIVSDFGVSFEETSTRMQLVIPLFALDPIKQLLSDHTFVEQSQPNPNWKIWLADSLRGSKANLRVEVGKAEATLGQILSLQNGDTIQLERLATSPLPLFIEGVPKFSVRMGSSCGKKAVQIEQIIQVTKGSEEEEA